MEGRAGPCALQQHQLSIAIWEEVSVAALASVHVELHLHDRPLQEDEAALGAIPAALTTTLTGCRAVFVLGLRWHTALELLEVCSKRTHSGNALHKAKDT